MQHKSDPGGLSLITTLTLVGVNLIIFFLFYLLESEMGFWVYILGAITISIFSYFIIYHTLETFIYKKIKLVYKNIHRLKRGKSINELDLHSSIDMFEDVNKEVMEWAKMQKDEIQQLKSMEKYRRDFLGNVSHELKTPIFNIQGYILTLIEGGLYDNNINMAYLEKTAKSVERMISMVKDLETISALESGIIEVQPFKMNAVDLAIEVIEFLEVKAKQRGIHLFLAKGNNQIPIFVMAEKERIRQVFINLIDNAIKYIGDTQSPYIKISFYDMDENILIEVSDNGMGISIENIPFLFDRFFRVDKARSRDQGGTGLGLAIVKHIIEAHKQTINVRSSVGVGTTFSFTLAKV
jgi:two-component system phosphate regulon sensor histidine kinase PhoR